MTSFKLLGAALIVATMVAPASAQAIGEPAAAESLDPNFSIYSSGGGGPLHPMASRSFNTGTRAQMHAMARSHRASRAPTRY